MSSTSLAARSAIVVKSGRVTVAGPAPYRLVRTVQSGGSNAAALGVIERTSGDTARLIDIPPLELKELRASLAELRAHVYALVQRAEQGRPAPERIPRA